ncbi:MAG: pyridoxamine 5'-phosphate oxidase family protein [Cyanobacteria bacterium P01_D01_bin.105]
MTNLSPQKLSQLYEAFPAQFRSVVLGTANIDGVPQASYAPCIMDEARNIYIFVSGLSAHTQNLAATGRASALFVKDESDTPQMFARQRLSYACTAQLLDRDGPEWVAIAQKFKARFGNIVEVMTGLPDFRIFQLTPKSGRFVVGFGAAYDVDPDDLSRLIHRSPKP